MPPFSELLSKNGVLYIKKCSLFRGSSINIYMLRTTFIQISRLKHKIIHDTNNITSTFAVTVLRVYQLLKQNHTPVDEVRIMLQFLGCRTSNKTGSDSITMFSGSDEMSESKDMAQLFECLRKYSSWYNYRLMKEVAEQFAGDEGKRLIADYEANLLRYYVSLVAYQCPDFVLEQKVPPGYTQVIVKVDWDFMSTNLQDISTFQANLADILELEPYVFQLRSVDEGCVRLEWAIPDALEPYVAEMMAEKEECLRKLRVLRMEVVSASSPLAGEKIFIGQPPSRKVKTKESVFPVSKFPIKLRDSFSSVVSRVG